MDSLQWMLCGWYVYMAVLAGLATLSAGPRTKHGLVAAVALVACVLLLVTVWWVPGLPLLASNWNLVTLVLGAVPLVAGGLLIALAPRQDTKLIALLLAGSSLLPLVLHFWQPGA
jgi:hypothetical protein